MLYPFKLDIDRSRVLRLELNEAAFRSASFLDERILQPGMPGRWIPLPELEAQTDPLPAQGESPIHFIFHTGHVGSTLVSRLLDESGRTWPLREPLPLRTLAAVQDGLSGGHSAIIDATRYRALVSLFSRLWRRCGLPDHSVILKATSSAARAAPALLEANPGSKAIYLNVGAERYLATLLAGENSLVDLQGHSAERRARLARHLGGPLPESIAESPGQIAACAWLAETLTQRELLAQYPGRVLPVDFDSMLGDLSGHLRVILPHFGFAAGHADVEKLVRSPALKSYSKAPERSFDPSVRAAILQDARQRHQGEIRKGLQLLEKLRPR